MNNDPKETPKIAPTGLHDLSSLRVEKKLELAKIRYMIRADLPGVEQIENRCREYPWSHEDFLHNLKARNVMGLASVLESQGNEILAGFIIYELKPSEITILNLAVDPDLHRKGLGTQMVQILISKLSPDRRMTLEVNVREKNLGGQLFLKRAGFRAEGILEEHFPDSGEAAYSMRYRLQQAN